MRYDQLGTHITPFCNRDFNDSVEKELQLSPQIVAFIVFCIHRVLDKMSCIYAHVISTSRIASNKFRKVHSMEWSLRDRIALVSTRSKVVIRRCYFDSRNRETELQGQVRYYRLITGLNLVGRYASGRNADFKASPREFVHSLQHLYLTLEYFGSK